MDFQTLPPCLSLRDNVRAYYYGIYRCTITSPAGAIQLVKKISLAEKISQVMSKNQSSKFTNQVPASTPTKCFLH